MKFIRVTGECDLDFWINPEAILFVQDDEDSGGVIIATTDKIDEKEADSNISDYRKIFANESFEELESISKTELIKLTSAEDDIRLLVNPKAIIDLRGIEDSENVCVTLKDDSLRDFVVAESMEQIQSLIEALPA